MQKAEEWRNRHGVEPANQSPPAEPTTPNSRSPRTTPHRKGTLPISYLAYHEVLISRRRCISGLAERPAPTPRDPQARACSRAQGTSTDRPLRIQAISCLRRAWSRRLHHLRTEPTRTKCCSSSHGSAAARSQIQITMRPAIQQAGKHRLMILYRRRAV
jgi:hypothetical protein